MLNDVFVVRGSFAGCTFPPSLSIAAFKQELGDYYDASIQVVSVCERV